MKLNVSVSCSLCMMIVSDLVGSSATVIINQCNSVSSLRPSVAYNVRLCVNVFNSLTTLYNSLSVAL